MRPAPRARARRAGEDALADHLVQARLILDEAVPPALEAAPHVSADFDHLRWFDLPAGCLLSGPRGAGPAASG